jgi:hypothetical protein
MIIEMPFHDEAQTGPYRLVIQQNEGLATTWRLRNISIFKRSVSWYARPAPEGPRNNKSWIPFENTVGQKNGGLLFSEQAKRFQVLGKGHFEGASIQSVKFTPRYSTLGRFVWPEDWIVKGTNPIANFSSINNGRTYNFTSTSFDLSDEVINWYWVTSDGGSYFGTTVSHTFQAAGTYGVTLIVTNSKGLIGSANQIVSVA